uniref:hypothetical protein n=1 Tax=Campylobacter jejuni TaxID=197 RepID=UPI0022421904
QKQYPEVNSLEESLAILKKYKDDITKEQYEGDRKSICGHAIEHMIANEKDVIDMIKNAKHEENAHEKIAEYKREC